MKRIKVLFGLILYRFIGRKMPMSYTRLNFGARKFRQFCAKLILDDCGKWVNIEKNVQFDKSLKVGNGSGIGENSVIQSGVIIGENVMIGRELLVFTRNHKTSDLTVPMGAQGFEEIRPVVIGDDVWIGARVTILPGVHIGNGCVIGAGSVVTKNVPDYEIWGGNPAHFIKSRKESE